MATTPRKLVGWRANKREGRRQPTPKGSISSRQHPTDLEATLSDKFQLTASKFHPTREGLQPHSKTSSQPTIGNIQRQHDRHWLDARTQERGRNPTHEGAMRVNSNEKDGAKHIACRVLTWLQESIHAQAYTATGGQSLERKPFREVVGRSPTHESSMK